MTPHSVQIKINDTSLSIETGKVAKQADGSVVVRCGGTVVLSTAVASRTALEGRDFLPLTASGPTREAASRAASSSGKAGPTRRRR
jgi:polyribonucleotide nucleotidyltransferase